MKCQLKLKKDFALSTKNAQQKMARKPTSRCMDTPEKNDSTNQLQAKRLVHF
jgi:hypothetical protein